MFCHCALFIRGKVEAPYLKFLYALERVWDGNASEWKVELRLLTSKKILSKTRKKELLEIEKEMEKERKREKGNSSN